MATISPSSHDQLSARFGATPAIDGIHFSVWAPEARELQMVVQDGGSHRLLRKTDGYFQGILPARAGDRYKFLVDGKGPFSDPASRYQPDGPYGWSEIVDPNAF